jgi:hypothetical protein
LARIDRTAAEQAALKAVPGTVLETELEADDNGYVVYDVEVAGNDGKSHDVKGDAGNGEILDQGLKRTSTKPTGPLKPKTLMNQAIPRTPMSQARSKTPIEESPKAGGEPRWLRSSGASYGSACCACDQEGGR